MMHVHFVRHKHVPRGKICSRNQSAWRKHSECRVGGVLALFERLGRRAQGGMCAARGSVTAEVM